MLRLALLCLLLLLASCSALPPAERHSPLSRVHHRAAAPAKWVPTWNTAAQPYLPFPPYAIDYLRLPIYANVFTGSFRNATLRQTVKLTRPGSQVHVRFANYYASTPLPIALTLGNVVGVSGIVNSPVVPLKFNGSTSGTVLAGASISTDALNFAAPENGVVTVSVYLAKGQDGASFVEHAVSLTDSWVASGNQVLLPDLRGGVSLPVWALVVGVNVLSDAPGAGAFLAWGDSITDGFQSTRNANKRWTDALYERLRKRPGNAISVVNQGISSEKVLSALLSPSGLSRFDRDVLSQANVKHVFLFEGTNDIGLDSPDPWTQARIVRDLTNAYQLLSDCLRARGIKVWGSTLTPSDGSIDGGGTREVSRQKVNAWIRSSKAYDVVVDFDAAIRDPANPIRMLPRYDSGDHLHPSDAGYAAMAAAVPLDQLV